jgi:hypothetical protein
MPRPHIHTVSSTLIVCALGATLTSCDTLIGSRAHSRRVLGPPVAVGAGTARTYVLLDSRGDTRSIGVILSAGALTNLPASETEFVLNFPPGRSIAPFDHIGLDFAPHGHEPPGIYDVPHFDVHFYMLSLAARDSIPFAPSDPISPPPTSVPPDYISTQTVIPRMGVHWVDTASTEFQPGGLFTKTVIYGFYGGRFIFLEPMATIAYLQSHPNSSDVFKQPQDYPQSGNYPTRYNVRYDSARSEYMISIEGLVPRVGT